MHCLVTGVAGFVGSTLAEELLRRGHPVLGVDCFLEYYPRARKERNLSSLRKSPGFTFAEESLVSVDISRLLDGVGWVFHQAGQAGVRASWGGYFSTYTDNNVLASQRLLEACRNCREVPRVVYASSSSIYGNAERFPTPEEIIPQPVSPYGVTKLAAEHLMRLYASEFGVPTVSLRYFTVFGPRQRPDMGFHRFIEAALRGQTIELYGTGEQSRDFTFITDIVEANILAAERGGHGAVYNIGGGVQASVNQILSFLSEEIGALKIDRKPRQHGDALHTKADTSRAQRELGFQPKVSLEEGIRRQIAAVREEISPLA